MRWGVRSMGAIAPTWSNCVVGLACVRGYVREQGLHEHLETEFGHRLHVLASAPPVSGGHEETRSVVEVLLHQSVTEQLIPAGIRGVPKFLEYLEVRLPDCDRRGGPIGLLKVHEVPKPWPRGLAELPLAEGLPEIGGGPERFFGAVVVVVPEGGTDVGLHLQGGEEQPVLGDDQVPLLDGPEKAGQLQVLLQEEACFRSAGLNEEMAD